MISLLSSTAWWKQDTASASQVPRNQTRTTLTCGSGTILTTRMTIRRTPPAIPGEHGHDYIQFTYGSLSWQSKEPNGGAQCTDMHRPSRQSPFLDESHRSLMVYPKHHWSRLILDPGAMTEKTSRSRKRANSPAWGFAKFSSKPSSSKPIETQRESLDSLPSVEKTCRLFSVYGRKPCAL